MKQRAQAGFTLVEIMIVVVIIGMLAALAIPTYQRVRQQAREKAIVSNLRQLVAAAQQYMLQNGVTSVNGSQLIGTGKHINSITPVAGESYEIDFSENQTSVSVTSEAVTVTYSI